MATHAQSKKTARLTHGTVVAFPGFNANTDAITLRNSMKGVGTDEDAIIKLITSRTNAQRQQIKAAYKQAHGRELIADLKSELSGHFEDVVLALFMQPSEYDAHSLHKAMDGVGTKESTLIEILVTRSNEEIHKIGECYQKLFSHMLVDTLTKETSGDFRSLLLSLQSGSRDSSSSVDAVKAKKEAQSLYKAGEKKLGTDEEKFTFIFASKSFPQLKEIFVQYQQIAGKDIVDSIKSEFSGDIEDGLLAIVEAARSKPAYFAHLLNKSTEGLGTDDSRLIRIIVSRCEIDMVEIKQQFFTLYKKSLHDCIKDDTSGDYKSALLGLVGQ